MAAAHLEDDDGGTVSGKNKNSNPAFEGGGLCVGSALGPLPVGGRGAPVLPGQAEQVAAGWLQVPLVPGQDPHADLLRTQAHRVEPLQLETESHIKNQTQTAYIWHLIHTLNVHT